MVCLADESGASAIRKRAIVSSACIANGKTKLVVYVNSIVLYSYERCMSVFLLSRVASSPLKYRHTTSYLVASHCGIVGMKMMQRYVFMV